MFIIIAMVCFIWASLAVMSVDVLASAYTKQAEVILPILMYHRVFDGGHKSRYIITPKQLEDDLIELKKAGYTAVLPREVVEFIEGKGQLPLRPIMLTFDDGHYNTLHYALPLFRKHGFKGVVNIVGKYSEYASKSGDRGNVKSSFLSWCEISELKRSGLFEIGSHTYNMHEFQPRFGIRRLENETDEQYRMAIKNDDLKIKNAIRNKAGIEDDISIFAYPFGAYYKDSAKLFGELGYKMIFTCNEKINIIKAGNFGTLLELGRFNRESKWTSKEMIEAIKAKNNLKKASGVFVVSDNIEIISHDGEIEDNKQGKEQKEQDFIRWIDFNADGGSLKAALKFCKEYRKKGVNLEFCQLLSHITVKNSNKFTINSTKAILKKLRLHLDNGGAISDMHKASKYYRYYLECYHAIFDGLVGEFKRECGTIEYGIKGYFPIAAGFSYSHYDDFGSSRSYGYKRRHLGHDFIGLIGTPIIAVEGGIITELGWNKYGGWRIGIRSFDQKRYYYYAHLRKNKPFAAGLKIGDKVAGGQVIGYLGHTGYSDTENTNLKSGSPHLHLGLQIIFDKSQENGSGEIWIDLYGISNFLINERVSVVRDDESKEWFAAQNTKKLANGDISSN